MRATLSLMLLLWSSLTCVLSCSGEAEGEVQVTVFGESFIEEGISADELGDAWAVTFDRFSVTIDEVLISGVRLPVMGDLDLTTPTGGSGQLLARASLPVGEHNGVRFDVTRVEVTGRASKGEQVKTFDWVFDQPTRYSSCDALTVVREGGLSSLEVTIHADHLLYDSLVAEEPQVLFQALADADLDQDGVITPTELERTDIGAYDPGSAGEVSDLWAWLNAQSQTLAHVNGEGHCDARALSN